MDIDDDPFIAMLYQMQLYEENEDATNQSGIPPRNLMEDFENETLPTERVMVYHVQSTNNETTFECPVCWDNIDMNNRVTTMCDHHYCSSCMENILRKSIENKTQTQCPMCRESCTLLETQNETVFNTIKDVLDKSYEETAEQEDYTRQHVMNNINSEINNLFIRRFVYEPYEMSSVQAEIAANILQSFGNS